MMEKVGRDSSATVFKWTGFASIVQGLLIFIPTFVLGAAINWPDSLDDPASVALPRLLENEGAVRAGYFAYLIYSILFAISMALLSEVVFGKNGGILMRIVIALAVASALARSIGIVRWLFPMFNSYGGTIGEVLGVSLFAAIAILLLSIGNLKERTLPKWFSYFGLISAIGLLWTSVEMLGIDPGSTAIFLGTTLVQFWFLFIGVWLIFKSTRLASK